VNTSRIEHFWPSPIGVHYKGEGDKCIILLRGRKLHIIIGLILNLNMYFRENWSVSLQRLNIAFTYWTAPVIFHTSFRQGLGLIRRFSDFQTSVLITLFMWQVDSHLKKFEGHVETRIFRQQCLRRWSTTSPRYPRSSHLWIVLFYLGCLWFVKPPRGLLDSTA